MPKDEFDFDDPMELNGIGIVCAEDTTDAMTECFVEEFMRLGHNHKQILALFRNPHYLGMNLAMEKRGEQFVRDTIAEVFARRGKVVTWPVNGSDRPEDAQSEQSIISNLKSEIYQSAQSAAATNIETTTDPMGAPPPDLTV